MRTLQIIAMVVALICCTPVNAQGQGWSRAEKQLIDQAKCSRMRVTLITSQQDSLLLRQVCKPLSRRQVRSPHFARLAASMIETVNNPSDQGVGIAAPQVAVLRRVVAVQRIDKQGQPFEIYVNPRITAQSDELTVGGEGCLSVPDTYGRVARSKWITLEWRDPIDFSLHTERIEGFVAVIFQHEIDHLDGILYIDRAESLRQTSE